MAGPGAAGAPAMAATLSSKGPSLKLTVRRGDIFRRFSQFHFVKMNPYVEVSLGDAVIGTVPPAMGADLQPVWNHTLQPQEFAVGQELQMKVLDRNNWPRKDVIIGIGSVTLTADFLGRERLSVEQSVQLYKKHQGEKPEVTGTVSFCMNFTAPPAGEAPAPLPPPMCSPSNSCASLAQKYGPQKPQAAPQDRAADGPPGLMPRSVPSTPSIASASGNLANAGGGDAPGGHLDDASVASTSKPDRLRARRPDRPPADPITAQKRRLLVAHQYYERQVCEQRQRPVLCTDGIQQLWQQWPWLRLSSRVCACASGTMAASWALGCFHFL